MTVRPAFAWAALYFLAPSETAAATSPHDPPHVIAVSPASGSSIAAGQFTLRITFDREMRRDSYSLATDGEADFPSCAMPPRTSADGRTFEFDCKAGTGRSYEIWINRAPYMNFKSAAAQEPATPHRLSFRTGK